MFKYILLVYFLSLLNIKSFCRDKETIQVFLGAGCGYSKDVITFLNDNHSCFDEIKIYVIEDSIDAACRIGLNPEDLKKYDWHFNQKKHFAKYKIKKVPSFMIGTLTKKKKNIYSLKQIADWFQCSD